MENLIHAKSTNSSGKWEKCAIYRVSAFPSFSIFSIVCIYVRRNIIRSFLWLKTFLSSVPPVKLQGFVHLKSSKLRKSCKFTVDTKDRKVCKPEKISRRFSGCNFSIFLGNTIYIYIYIYYNQGWPI